MTIALIWPLTKSSNADDRPHCKCSSRGIIKKLHRVIFLFLKRPFNPPPTCEPTICKNVKRLRLAVVLSTKWYFFLFSQTSSTQNDPPRNCPLITSIRVITHKSSYWSSSTSCFPLTSPILPQMAVLVCIPTSL